MTTATRSQALPDIPVVADFLPGYEANAWYGIGAPKNTPTEIVDRLSKEIDAHLADPKMKAQLADLGAVPMPMTPVIILKSSPPTWGVVPLPTDAKRPYVSFNR